MAYIKLKNKNLPGNNEIVNGRQSLLHRTSDLVTFRNIPEAELL
jgi:hypothetical protein